MQNKAEPERRHRRAEAPRTFEGTNDFMGADEAGTQREPNYEIDWEFVRQREPEIVGQLIQGGRFGSLGCWLMPVVFAAGLVSLFVYLPLGVALLALCGIAYFMPGKHMAYSTTPALRDHGRRHARLATASLVMSSPKLFEQAPRGLGRHGVFAVRAQVHAASAIVTLDPDLSENPRRLRELARYVASLGGEPGPSEAELKPLAERATRGRMLVTDSRGNYLPAAFLPSSLTGNEATFDTFIPLHRELIPGGQLEEESLEWTLRFPVLVVEGTHQVRVLFVPYWYWNEELYRTSQRRYPHAEMAVVEGLGDELPKEAADWPVVSRERYRQQVPPATSSE